MKRNKLLSRGTALLLALALTLGLCPVSLAAGRSLTLRSLEDLTAFAKNCASDRYSDGLTVRLAADIDAEGTAVSIPLFLGTFDGQGHSISGLRLTESNSAYGLFSRVETGAAVRDLTVEAEVTPSGEQSRMGGIAGENAGSIENCAFSGVVVGSAAVGGIAGYNEGTVQDCSVSGVIRGTQYTGGIAGQNAGTLLRCENRAAVNTTVTEEDITAVELEELESTLYRLLKREEVTETAVTTDTGGIAGFSTGVIQSCTNRGSVGYAHVGYNVGGIAGRQNGYLASCDNRGSVQGRKDVGGIVGQMVPDITLQFSSNSLDQFQSELNTLQGLIDRTLTDAQSASDTVSGHVARISDYAASASDSANDLAGEVGDFADDNIETVNSLLLLVERYLAKASPIFSDLSDASDSVSAAIAETRKLVALLEDTLDYNDQALTQLQSFCAETKAACDAILTGLDALETAFTLIKNGPAQPDTSALRAEVAALREAVTTLEATIGRAGEELAIRGAVSPGTQAQLREDLLAVLDGCAYVTKALAEVVVNTDLSALRDQDLETLRQIAASLQTAMSSFRSAIAHLSAAMGHLQDFFGTLRTLNAHLDGILAQLDAALQQAEAAADSLSSAFSRMAKWARDLSQEEPGSFTPLGPGAEESGSALNASLTGISSEISALNTELSRSNTALISDLRAVNAQFMKVMNLFLNVLNDTQNVNYEDVYEDVSDESLQSATRGKVLECANYGAVTADRNAGGIAGSMAIEYDLDPEDDLQTEGQRSTRFTYQTKAILLSCQNYGTVQAKKSCAGGITGRMDLDTVSQCGGWGNVESESGDYVGGVAGLSLSSIRGSWAKCALSGGRYVGGIAGSGSRVTDCLSLVEITEAAQQSGAIAGEITGDYQGNRFVSETLAGVDRVSLSGKAEAISYDQLTALASAPENFRRLTLRFVADGRTLKEQTFDYGASFPESVYPDAPEKDDYYVRWDRESLNELHFDTTVTAVYEPYVTTLSSAPQDAHPALLVEGKFRLGERMEAQQSTSPVPGSGSLVETWTLTLPEDGEASHTVHWRLPDTEETYTVYLKEDGTWRKTESETIGSYLRFDLPAGAQFAVASAASRPWQLWAPAGAGCAGIAVVLLLFLRKRKTKGPKESECELQTKAR